VLLLLLLLLLLGWMPPLQEACTQSATTAVGARGAAGCSSALLLI
jgi:hypothetical protein